MATVAGVGAGAGVGADADAGAGAGAGAGASTLSVLRMNETFGAQVGALLARVGGPRHATGEPLASLLYEGAATRVPDAIAARMRVNGYAGAQGDSAAGGNRTILSETGAARRVARYFTARAAARAVALYGADYVELGLPLPAWLAAFEPPADVEAVVV